ncbi:Lactamase-B domain-containing protein [Mycena chlorophos]|uniref:hydroxyacylglutathione hydrolase n=1 Tax=Mycena chlorophos TaxID=658473 RepID=A0A8H6TTL6_MYCCL|nr:Lactamase-B domain-containing protein [Mycena chlorophos]
MQIVAIRAPGDAYCYLLIDTVSREAAVVDPPVDIEELESAATRYDVQLVAALNTNHHRSGGNTLFASTYPSANIYAGSSKSPAATHIVGNDDEIPLGRNLRIRVLATPCHTADSLCFHVVNKSDPTHDGALFTGDTLLVAGCGSFGEGSAEEMHAVLTRLEQLPESTVVYGGHDVARNNWALATSLERGNNELRRLKSLLSWTQKPVTTIGDEKQWNPYLRSQSKEIRNHLSLDPADSAPAVLQALKAAQDDLHVRLALSPDGKLYLHIPVNYIHTNCKLPIKYLLFLAWCILGQRGTIQYDAVPVAEDEPLIPYQTYEFVPANPTADLFDIAVDMEVIARRSQLSTDSSCTTEFKDSLRERDVHCVFTGQTAFWTEGMHLVAVHKGDQWFNLITQNRAAVADADEVFPNGIDGPENGMLVFKGANSAWDTHMFAILKTPNAILEMDDIPPPSPPRFQPRHESQQINGRPIAISNPLNARFTVQWFAGSLHEQSPLPANTDAAFNTNAVPRIPLPSALLCHYIYGASAVKHWGRGVEDSALTERANMPRPPPASIDASRGGHRQKRRKTTSANADGQYSAEASWDDAEWVVLLLSANTPEAAAHRRMVDEETRRQERETMQSVERWRREVFR